jgi:hypothetical protein
MNLEWDLITNYTQAWTLDTTLTLKVNNIIECKCNHMCWCCTLIGIGHGHVFDQKCLCYRANY